MNLEEEIRQNVRNIPNFPKEGIQFKDITPIFKKPELWDKITDAILEDFKHINIDGIAGLESRGFLFGPLLAKKLKVPFILIRKKGKLPAETISYSYDLEYGNATLEMHTDAFSEKSKILIHDDLLATGGTAVAASELIQQLKGVVAGYSFIVGLDFLNGEERLIKYSKNISTLVRF